MNGINMSTVTNYMLGSTQVINIYYGQTLVWPLTPHDYSQDYFTIESLADNNQIHIITPGTRYPNAYYSLNNGSWTSFGDMDLGLSITINTNDKLLLKASGLSVGHDMGIIGITANKNVNVYGNIMSLQDSEYFTNSTTISLQNEFSSMFYSGGIPIIDASNLILPATTLTVGCYSNMFRSCNSLTSAPKLPASTVPNSAYYGMFYGCSSLNRITCLATNISGGTSNWVTNVATTGTFTKAASMNSWTTGPSGIPAGWNVQNYRPISHDYSQDYLTFEALEASTFTWTSTKSSNSISYSTDNGSTWSTLTAGSSTPTIAANNKVLFKASNLTVASSYGIGTFSTSGRCNIMGNVMSLVYGDNFTNQTTINSSYQFCKLFNECTTLVDASDLILPATTLSDRCYYWMFRGCSSLTTAPELPATTVYNRSYYSMFANCSSLTTAPDLPATTIDENCYAFMFQNCSSLTTAPSILPATTLALSCYSNMFQNCTSLTTAPELPATILATRCYETMFKGCTLLNYIKCLATDISAYLATNNWVVDVAASGTFVKARNSQAWNASSAGNGIPSGWTVQNAS